MIRFATAEVTGNEEAIVPAILAAPLPSLPASGERAK
ncbi:MAG: hypothetical protein V4472_05990 [Pseudomonadota bacterium]